jgi:hypothetical protein
MSPKVTESMPASTTVAFGATAALTKLVDAVRTGIHMPVRVERTASHSASGPVTWYQVKPSALRGPPTMATVCPAVSVATRRADASADVRALTASTAIRPKPPTASAGVAS